jgi:hypothetical protein
MYKCTPQGPIPKSLAHRSNANKGTTCRLPVTVHGSRPSPDTNAKSAGYKGSFAHQDAPAGKHPVRQHYEMALGGKRKLP